MSREIRLKEFFRKLHHKKPVRVALHGLLNLLFPFIAFYARFIEPRLIHVTRTRIPVRRLPKGFEGFRIVQISDIHFGPTNDSVPFLRKCVQMINELKPDIVAMTGDFLQWDSKYSHALAHILSDMRARFGLFASLGNHDYGVCHKGHPPSDPIDYREVMDAFRKRGIRVLHNERFRIEQGGEGLDIVGLGDYWTEHFHPSRAFQKAGPRERPTILLSHNPDTVHELDHFDFDLMLAGHVHGGQISLPFFGPLAVPVKHRHLRRGLHNVKNRWLYTNRGLGFIFQARFLSRPEIACLELIPDSSDLEAS